VVLATLLAIYIVNYADRYLITGLIGPIKAQFGIGDAMVGMLMGPAFVLLYVILGVPFARLADRTSRTLERRDHRNWPGERACRPDAGACRSGSG
jgi:predicted MFS family arabinose efflux permease